jgi:hypothetical protein
VDSDAFQALLTDTGQELLAGLAAHDTPYDTLYDEGGALATATRLRRTYPPELVAAALTQARLRTRARAKFGAAAADMYFTPVGLEQSTRASVAAHRAARYAAAGVRRVADLCCGIGADTLAFARAGIEVLAVDRAPDPGAVAVANAAAAGFAERIDVRCANATEIDLVGCDAVFVDPARRTDRGRVFDVRTYSPPWSFLLELTELVAAAGFKVAPGIPHALVPPGAEAEWVSDAGDVKEAGIYLGPLADVAVGGLSTANPPTPAANANGPTLDTPSAGNPGGGRAGADAAGGASGSRTGSGVGSRAGGTGGGAAGGSGTAGGGGRASASDGTALGGAAGGGGARRRATLLPAGMTLVSEGCPDPPVAAPGVYLYEPDGAVIRAHLLGELAARLGATLIDPTIAYVTSDRLSVTPYATAYRITDVLPFGLKRLRALVRERGIGTLTVKKRGSPIDPERLRAQLRPAGPATAVLIVTRVAGQPSALFAERA